MIKELPHHGVYTRLGPSKIHGVGVFSIKHIPKGTYVFAGDDESIVWVAKKKIKNLPRAIRDLYDDFCIIKGNQYGCPRNFDSLTPAWYLNHSSKPNIAADKRVKFYALRDIKKGEELTVDYRTYSEMPSSLAAE
jgi:SET domain-containing protein